MNLALAQQQKWFIVLDENLLPAMEVKVRVNGIEIPSDMPGLYIVNDSIQFPYDVILEKEGYPTIQYSQLRNLADRFYLIPAGHNYYWEENIKVPFKPMSRYAALFPKNQGDAQEKEKLNAFLLSIGLVEASEFYLLAEDSLGKRGTVPTWQAVVVKKLNGEDFKGADDVFAKLRESDLIEEAGPLLGYNFFLSDGIGVRFFDQHEAEATRVLKQALGKEIEYKPYGGIYRKVDTNPNLGLDVLKLIESLQDEPVFITVSVLKESLYWVF